MSWSKCNTNLKIFNTKVNWSACEVTLLLSCAVCTLSSHFKTKIFSNFFCILATTAKKQVIWGLGDYSKLTSPLISGEGSHPLKTWYNPHSYFAKCSYNLILRLKVRDLEVRVSSSKKLIVWSTIQRVCNTGVAQIAIKGLIYKYVTSAVFLGAYTNQRNTSKASYLLWF